MKTASIQMDMDFAKPDENYIKAEMLIRKAAKEKPDVIVLPETWNTGFFPHDDLAALCDRNGERTKALMSGLAAELCVNIVAGSVSNIKNGKVYNTCCVFDRTGACIAEYDKTHLFTPMREHEYFEAGDHLCTFEIDGNKCAVLICYDIRFPELTRTLSVKGLDFLFLPSQWPNIRMDHLTTLLKARAIENQMFTVGCNSCGKAGDTTYGGGSAVFDPWGKNICTAGESEEIIYAECDTGILSGIRSSINVFRDRRESLYNINK